MVNPFNLTTVFLAKHAQHVVLIHFPIASVHHGGGVRPYRTMDEAPGPGGRGLLQPDRGGDFDSSSSRYWAARVAVPTGGTETEGHPVAAPRSGMCFDGNDLAGLVAAFPRSTLDRILAELPSGR